MRTKRRTSSLRWTLNKKIEKEISKVESLIATRQDIAMSIDAALIDSICLHASLSKLQAMSLVMERVLSVNPMIGVHQFKIKNKPIVFRATFTHLKMGTKVDVSLSTKKIIVSVDKLSSMIADKALRDLIGSPK